MEILIVILIATALAHGGIARGRDAARDGFHSVRNAARALRGRGGPGAKDRLLNDYRDGRAFTGERAYQQPVSKARPDAAGVSKRRLLAAAVWRGYKGGWTGETARRRNEADEVDRVGEEARSTEEPSTANEMAPPKTSSTCLNGHPANGNGNCFEHGCVYDNAKRHSAVVDRPPQPPTTSGGPRMTITTATGGEILSYPQLLAELDAIVAEAAAELEDRQAAKQRAQDDVARIDLMLASLSRLELDRESLAKLQAIAETNGLKVQLANQAADNAEHRHALAVNAKDTVVRKHQMLQEAHSAAGRDAAQKAFYQAG